MTPTQLKAYSAVVRLGSVKDAAAELGVTEAAVSMHVGQLRKQLDDQLFVRTPSGLSFTPGGLRLARRAVELLGLQDRTIREVSQAAHGRRMLRVAASGLFAEYAAPGLIELFTGRSRNLDVELSVCRPRDFAGLLASRAADVAIGPCPAEAVPDTVEHAPFLNYTVVLVTAPDHPLARFALRAQARPPGGARRPRWPGRCRAVTAAVRRPRRCRPRCCATRPGSWARPRWGRTASRPACCAGSPSPRRTSGSSRTTRPRSRRPSGAAGVAFAVSFAVHADLASGAPGAAAAAAGAADGAWSTLTARRVVAAAGGGRVHPLRADAAGDPGDAARGAGVGAGHFRRAVHVTLWS